MTEHVLVEKSEKILMLTLNRPDKKNALTRAMYKTLAAEITAADSDRHSLHLDQGPRRHVHRGK